MAYVSLYRKFRPDSFDKVIGQDYIVRTLRNQIKNNRIGHSYLFTGTRGTGKTSCAKIFAKAVNCLNPVNGSPCHECKVCKELAKPGNIDIIEIDAASNNGVEEIRQLKENTQYRPISGRYKVYIIDETHMLTPSAFNALLKTLEEPPEYIIFILATTEAQKLPATILSRCLRFDFRLVPAQEIKKFLCRIFDEMGVKYEEKAIEQIAVCGEGSVRDAISIADMCMSYCDNDITLAGVLEALGASDFDTLHRLGQAILAGDGGQALTILDKLIKDGKNTIHKDLCNYFRDLMVIKNVKDQNLSSATPEQADKLKALADNTENYRIVRVMEILTEAETALRYSTQPAILLQAVIIKACELTIDQSQEAMLTRLKELEKKVKDLAESGIKVAAKEIQPKPAKKDKKAETAPPPPKNISDKLAQSAAAVEEETIFEENLDEDEEKAYQAWDGIIKRLMQRGERALYIPAAEIYDDVRIKGKTLYVNTANNAVIKLFTQPQFMNIMKECVKEVLGEDYGFVCEKKTEKTDQTREGVRKLKELFGPALKIKK